MVLKYWELGTITKMRGPTGAASKDVHRLRNKNAGFDDIALPPGLSPLLIMYIEISCAEVPSTIVIPVMEVDV